MIPRSLCYLGSLALLSTTACGSGRLAPAESPEPAAPGPVAAPEPTAEPAQVAPPPSGAPAGCSAKKSLMVLRGLPIGLEGGLQQL